MGETVVEDKSTRKRGRPGREPAAAAESPVKVAKVSEEEDSPVKRGRGRPKGSSKRKRKGAPKKDSSKVGGSPGSAGKRGRPKKVADKEENDTE